MPELTRLHLFPFRSFVPGIEKIASEHHVGNLVLTRGDNPTKVWEVRRGLPSPTYPLFFLSSLSP